MWFAGVHSDVGGDESFEGFIKVMGERKRKIPKSTLTHESVKIRKGKLKKKYRPENLEKLVRKHGWENLEQ